MPKSILRKAVSNVKIHFHKAKGQSYITGLTGKEVGLGHEVTSSVLVENHDLQDMPGLESRNLL